MDKITITLVKVRIGDKTFLVGRSASDRFNLQALGNTSLEDDRSQKDVKRLRRAFGDDFTFKVDGKGVQVGATPREIDALGIGLALEVAAVA